MLSVAALVCYIVFLSAGFLMAFGMLDLFKNNDADGLGGALVSLAAVILAIAGFIYAAAGILPTLFRALSIRRGRLIYPILCLPFDAVYIALNLSMLLNIFSGEQPPEAGGIVAAIALMLLSVTVLTLNVTSITLTVIYKRRENI